MDHAWQFWMWNLSAIAISFASIKILAAFLGAEICHCYMNVILYDIICHVFKQFLTWLNMNMEFFH